jgi:DNA-binding SARP family transcriptional activator/class 3 adenylate cyclase
MTKLSLGLLGGFRLETDAGELVPLTTRKAQALLAYLALHAGQPQARPKLAALLWGERTEAQARDSLRQALSLVRKALSSVGAQTLIAHEDTITFVQAALNVDAILFEGLVEEQRPERLQEAIGLYRGELLEGFQVPSPEFENWAAAERQRLRERALDAMTGLLEHYLVTGAIERGIHIAARLLSSDPLQERVHRTLMELYCRQGRHGTALRQYRACADLLAKELGIEPDAQTKALHRHILREWNRREGELSSGDPLVREEPTDAVVAEPPMSTRPPERRQLTVLVCDLAGIGTLADRLDPEELQRLFRAYQRVCTEVISRSGGTVRKLAGTQRQVHFGHPQAREYDAECAVRTGLSLIEAISKLDGGCDGPLQLRVGIASGPVVLWDFFGDGATQQEIIGEAVQIAGGLQAHAEPNMVVIAASTHRLVGGLFDCDDLGRVALEGHFEPIPAWRVRGTSAVDSRFEALRATSTPLVGREEELELLLRRWPKAASGNGQVVLLSGEPGIGKSRLAAALAEALEAEPHTRLRYFCSPHHQDSALYPTIRQLERAAGLRRDDTSEQRLDKLEMLLARSTNDLGGTAPLIADLLSVPFGDRYPPLNLTPQKRKQKTFDALLGLLEGLAARQPALMVFEDAHWVDPTSLEQLDSIIDRVSALSVLLIITYRPEFVPPWIGRPQVSLLTLNRLAHRQRHEMIAGLTRGKALPEEITEQIINRTDGVPLFIEELTKAVVESGLLVEAADRYTVSGPVKPLAIPTTLQASLLARLDRLAPIREIAQISATLGRHFSHELISAVAAMPQRQLDDGMEQLVRAELMHRRGTPPDAEYTFKHALVQDAAYASLTRGRRQEMHGRVARAIEERAPDVAMREPEVLAHHFTQANCAPQAIEYWLKAGQVALARSANLEAVSHLERGLAVVRSLPVGTDRDRHELHLQYALGTACNAAHGYGADATLAAFERARELIVRTGDDSNIDVVMEGLTTTLFNRAAYRDCLNIRLEFLAMAQRRGDPGSLGVAHRGIAGIHNVFGNFVDAQAHSEDAWSYHVSAKHKSAAGRYVRDIGVSVLCHLSIAEWHLGFLDRSRLHLAESLALAKASNHPNTAGYAHVWAAVLSFMARDFDALRQYASIVTRLGREQSIPYYASWVTCLDAAALATAGDDEGAVDMALTGQTLRKQFQARALGPVFLCALAEVHWYGRRNEAALSTIADALAIADRTEECWMNADLWRLKAEVISGASGRDTADEVEQHFHRALEIARGQGSRMFELRAATSMSRYLAAQRRMDCARGLLAPLYGWFTEGLDTPDLRAAKALLDQLG